MFGTATIVFREVLEVALVLGIVMAATRGVPHRGVLALAGLALGVAGSVIIAFFTDAISEAIDGLGQEVFNACIMFTAVAFLSWTVIWMKTHGRHLAQHLSEVGHDVALGKKSLYVLVGVIALATFREGAEIVLFTYGQTLAGVQIASIVMGGAIGLLGGTIVGFMLYFGLLKTVRKYLFAVTGWMLIFLTAGMAAQGAQFLVAAGMLPPIVYELWDTSNIISGHGFLGEMLSVLMGYTPRPSGMELVFYLAVLFGVGGAYTLVGRKKPAPMPAEASKTEEELSCIAAE